ncbi:hypothetical protein WMF30_49155 [Sorangium sp. So ce134]
MKDDHIERPCDLSLLVELALDAAKRNLAERGTFVPGSIVVDASGKYAIAVAAHGGVDGSNLLITALRQKAAAEQIRAAAVHRDVRGRSQGGSEEVDAIQVVAELASGESLNVFQVYRMEGTEPVFYDGPEVEQVPSVIFAESHRNAARAKRWWKLWK